MWRWIHERYVVRPRCRRMLRRYVEERPPGVAPLPPHRVRVIDITGLEADVGPVARPRTGTSRANG